MKFVGFTLGENIKYYRKLAGLTQEKLAEKIGKSTHFITQIERNNENPAIDTFADICRELEIPADYLLQEKDRHFKQTTRLAMLNELSTYDLEELEKYLLFARKVSEMMKKD